MISRHYTTKLTAMLSILLLNSANAGPIFGNGYGAGSASFGFGMGVHTGAYSANRYAPRPYYVPVPHTAHRRSDEPAADFSAFEIEEIGDKLHVRVPLNLLFEFDHYDLRPGAEQVLQTVRHIAQSRGASGMELHGHTDAKGTDEYNQRLSNLRTYTVKHWLITEGGFAATRVKTQGHGETLPVAPNNYPNGTDNPRGRAMNRRVEFII